MSGSNNNSPLVPIPLDELFRTLGWSANRSDSKKKTENSDSPLVAIPMDKLIRMLEMNIERNTKKQAVPPLQNIVPNNRRKTITFKIPKRLSAVNSNKDKISTKAYSRRTPAISSNVANNTKPVSHVRKALFSVESTPVPFSKPRNILKSQPSLMPRLLPNKDRQQKSIGNTTKTESIIRRPKTKKNIRTSSQIPSRTKNCSDDDFERAEALCNLESPADFAVLTNDFHHLQELFKKQHDLSLEIQEVWQRIYGGVVNAPVKTNITTAKLSSVKRTNLLKSILLKTVREDPTNDVLGITLSKPTKNDAKDKPIDIKMTESICMYNAMRGHLLQTPKVSRQSLEHGNSISTTVQKQCLMLMETPKN